MPEPSFPFYFQRWRANSNLRAATHAERGVWIDLLCLMAEQLQPGVLRWDLRRIARALNCEVAQLRSLHEQNILKGADSNFEGFVHENRMGMQVTLVAPCAGPVWLSSAMLMDGYLRKVASESGRKSAANRGNAFEAPSGAPSKVRRSTRAKRESFTEASSPFTTTPEAIKVDAGAPSKVRPQLRALDPPPPRSPSLILSPSYSPTTLQIPSESGDGASPPVADGRGSSSSSGSPDGHEPTKTTRRSRKITPSTLTADQQATRLAFGDWWNREAYPAAMQGVVYPFDGGRDAPAVLKILRAPSVAWDLERAKALASVYLRADDICIVNHGRPLHILGNQLPKWIQMAIRSRALHANPQHPIAGPARRIIARLDGGPASGTGTVHRAG